MKKLFSILSALICTYLQAQTIPNAGFETWITNTESPQHYLVPQNWISQDVLLNSYASTYTLSSVSRTTQSHSGQYAVLFETQIGGGDTAAGELYSCNSLTALGFPYGYYGFPYSLRSA